MNKSASLVSEGIAQRIHLVRGHKVMLDADLASLYNVETRALIQAVKQLQSKALQTRLRRKESNRWTPCTLPVPSSRVQTGC